MANWHVVRVKVESIRGKCHLHNLGQEWKIGEKTPEGICMGAFHALHPAIWTLQFGGSFPWGNDPKVRKIGCVDPVNTVTFSVERLDELIEP